jgi:hypothetical protein
MIRRRFLSTIAVSLFSIALGASQAASAAPLSGKLRSRLQTERFGLVTAVRGLPLGVRDELQKLFDSKTLDIAEPGAAFKVKDGGDSRLPTRRLIAAGCSYDYCLVYYERGGSAHTWRVALFHWTPDATRFEWGATAPGGLKTIDDVRRAIVSGAIKSPAASW